MSGTRKAGMLDKDQEGIREMEHSPEECCSLTQLKRQGMITLSGLVHSSFQQVWGTEPFGAVFRLQLISGWCLSDEWKSVEIYIYMGYID